ncbi:hypothetical protein [Nocardioides nitrophenolicus]|uniref:hypothetical protein n=1 Tax=Nocardioides nitrophenolicus TaxID=60489 RepID=UPI00195E25AE|nr:hypothetical protein [Nocardioides nitrophenolicus]MBM7518386.1 hypothetical protein [Nocardioides nitrophenolicus]
MTVTTPLRQRALSIAVRARLLVALLASFALALTAAGAAQADPAPDTTPPAIWVEIAPSHGTGAWVGWYRSSTAATIRASDSTGIAFLYYRLDGAQTGVGSTTSPPARLETVIGTEGLTTIVIDARDSSGNVAQLKYGVGIDLTDPTAAITGLTDGTTLKNGELRRAEFSCTDPGGAIVSCTATNDGAPFTSGGALATGTAGPHQLKVTAVDRVGRRSERILGYQVGRKELRIVSPPVITGNPTVVRVGQQLRVEGGTFEPTPDSISYQWWDGAFVVAHGTTFTPTTEHLGRRISVRAVGSGSGSEYGETVTVAVGSVLVRPALSPMVVVEQPTIGGNPVTVAPGDVLRANSGTFAPEPEQVTYLWFVGDELVGTDPTWTPGDEHVGASVRLMTVATHPDHFDTPSARTAAVRVVPRAPAPGGPGPGGPGPGGPAAGSWSLLSAATVKGKPAVGRRLRAVLPQLSAPAQTWTYQWLRNGTPIKGATTKTYRLRKTDRRDKVTVRITATSATGAVVVSTAKPKRIR